jgi:hypothetical protein
MDTVAQRFQTGRFGRRQPVAQYRGEDIQETQVVDRADANAD